MYKLINGDEMTVKDAATFIAQLNKYKEHHIGFCGTDVGEIVGSIKEDLTDVPFEHSFVGAVQEGKIVGLMGFAADLEGQRAEIWGPFVDSAYNTNVAFDLWDALSYRLPATIEQVCLFSNTENHFVTSFAKNLQFEEKTNQFILSFFRNQLEKLPMTIEEELTEQDYSAFVNLHESSFPGTYYNGYEIIHRVNRLKKVFIIKDGEQLAGYVYAEADPDFGEGAIEFIAVDQAYRGRGYGRKLLATAVKWLFTFESIKEITICVASDNKGAIGLYRSIGFQIEHELYYYFKNLI